jgi:hypothetical protein
MVLLAASGSILVAAPKMPTPERTKVFDLIGTPGEIRTPDPLVRDQVLPAEEIAPHSPNPWFVG